MGDANSAVSQGELEAVADAAVQRVGGRGVLGPIDNGANIVVLTTEDQDEAIFELIADAMRRAGASQVTHVKWSSLGLPTGDFSAADGWRELSDAHVETTISAGERVEQDALLKLV
jgi:hypothetical protein